MTGKPRRVVRAAGGTSVHSTPFGSVAGMLAALALAFAPGCDDPIQPVAPDTLPSDAAPEFGTVDLGGPDPGSQDVDGTVDAPAVEADGTAEIEVDAPGDDADPADGDATALDIPDNPAPPDVVDGDVPCEPDCDGRVCGNDGCGGICGYCTYPTVCDPQGQCAVVCEPDCDGKFCGSDGCGSTCGECGDGLECGQDGLCYEPTCVPDCAGKVCGSDGCGADCGVCVSPNVCTNGSCQLGPCGTVTETGECDGSILKWCEDEVTLSQDDCSQYPGYSCTYDGQINKYTCKDTGPCVPNCSAKNCGSDGCGGTCGTCNNNWSCVLGTCNPEEGGACGPYQTTNYCAGDTLWLCQPSNTLTAIECNVPPLYEKCSFDFSVSKYGCVPQ